MASSHFDRLLERLRKREARIGVIGLGYVGLPLAIAISEQGFHTVGFDSDPSKIEQIDSGRSYISGITDDDLLRARARNMVCSSDLSLLAEVDIAIICLPTPLDVHREPDLSIVLNTVGHILPFLHPGQALCLESTTYPGTTEEELRPRIEGRGLKVGEDFFLIYSPERQDPGNKSYNTRNIPKIVSGSTERCRDVAVAFYEQIVDRVVPVRTTQTAEMAKLLENIHRAVNISLVNELKIVADRMGIDIHEVIDAAATKPFGFVPYYPGPGLGGHCIPIDPFYLTWKAREFGVFTKFIELAGEVNTQMPGWVVEKIGHALNTVAKPIRGSRILLLGLAYKKNVNDVRESPSVEILSRLRALGADVDYADPYVPSFPKMRRYSFDMVSREVTPETLAEYDCVVVATDHDCFDYDVIWDNARVIVDCRGRFREESPKLVRA